MTSPPDPADEATLTADRLNRALFAILAVGFCIRVYLLFAVHATEEDFYITLRYAENIAAGHGFAYNIGHFVYGSTTPLYTLALALFRRAGLDPILFGKLLGISGDIVAALCSFRIGSAIRRPLAGLAAAACVMFAPVNLIWATKGMEVGLVAAAATAAWMFWLEKKEIAAWVCVAILVLLRIDGAALGVVMLAAGMLRDRRIPWRGVGVSLLICSPWFAYALIRFGSIAPLSATAKLTVYGRTIPGRFPQLVPFLQLMLHNLLGLLMSFGCLCFVVVAVLGLYNRSNHSPGYEAGNRDEYAPSPNPDCKPKSLVNQSRFPVKGSGIGPQDPAAWLLAPFVWITIYYAAMALSHVVLFGWYFVPPAPIFYLVGACGLFLVAERLGLQESAASSKRVSLVSGLVILVALNFVTPRVGRTLAKGQAEEDALRIPIGEWMHDHSAPGKTLMLEPIGYIGYYSGLPVIDEIGLVSPEALPSYSQSVPCPQQDLWVRLRPDWLLLRAGEVRTLEKYEKGLPPKHRLNTYYQFEKSWQDPANPHGIPAFTLYKRLVNSNTK